MTPLSLLPPPSLPLSSLLLSSLLPLFPRSEPAARLRFTPPVNDAWRGGGGALAISGVQQPCRHLRWQKLRGEL